MNMQEMSTAVQYRLPVKIFILNNQYMGMVRQWQELLHGGRYSESYTEALPDFVKLAEAYRRASASAATKPGELDDAISEMIDVDKPVIFDCVVDPDGELLPDDPVGQGAQRDAARRRRRRASTRRSPKKARCWCDERTTPTHIALSGCADRAEASSATRSRCWSTTSRRAGARHRPVLRPRLQHREPDRRPRPSTQKHLSRITIVTTRHADGDRADQGPARAAGAGAPGHRPDR